VQFLLNHPVTVPGELLRDLEEFGSHAVVMFLDGLVVEAAAIDLQEFAEPLDTESLAMLPDELSFGVERQ
jgi:hypothetical protein